MRCGRMWQSCEQTRALWASIRAGCTRLQGAMSTSHNEVVRDPSTIGHFGHRYEWDTPKRKLCQHPIAIWRGNVTQLPVARSVEKPTSAQCCLSLCPITTSDRHWPLSLARCGRIPTFHTLGSRIPLLDSCTFIDDQHNSFEQRREPPPGGDISSAIY